MKCFNTANVNKTLDIGKQIHMASDVVCITAILCEIENTRVR